MKKILLVAMAAGAMIPAYADGLNPDFMYNFRSYKISPDGKVIVSRVEEESAFYYVDSKETVENPMAFYVGNGNSVSANGKYIVGSTDNDTPVIFVDGEMMNLDSWMPAEFSLLVFHGITADGNRIVGITDNPKAAGTETMYAPIYVDVNADGSLGEMQYLPFPEKDWMGMDVQYCSAVWVSNDGKTILGQVKDWSGLNLYPIIYSQGGDGEWSYTLPTEAYINPDKLPLPEFPGEFNVPYVTYEDYMTPAQLEAYNKAVTEYYENEDWDAEYPRYEDFMDPEKVAAYEKAAEEYNRLRDEYNEKFMKYSEEKEAIEDTSLFFVQNGMTMSADGKTVAMAASVLEENDDPLSWFPWIQLKPTYVLDVASKDLRSIELIDGANVSVIPNQILSDGTIVSNTEFGATVETAYILAPGAEKYVVIEDYLAEKAPAAAAWMTENLSKKIAVDYDYDTDTEIYESFVVAGNVVVSDDWSVVSGGVFDGDLYQYQSYVITPDISGVSEVAADAELVSKKYYDLNGLEVKDPANGIYILRSVYSDGTVKAEKVVAE